MKNCIRLFLSVACLPSLALAAYAPIPEQEQGKALTYRLGASLYHDSNIFGASAGEVDSMVYNFSAGISYNGSLDDQTFLSAAYDLSYDHVVDRPGEKNLYNHGVNGRIAHAFSADTNLDVSGAYLISENPQSLLAGIPQNADQSFKRGQFDARYTTAAGQKTGVIAKYRFVNYAYETPTLADDLDRSENLLGLESTFAFLPETKLVGEYRYQTIRYDSDANLKDKDSHFLMGGFDYSPGKQLSVSARAGVEDRARDSAPDTTSPYLEFSSRYSYAENAFFAAGYIYTLEEPSDVVRFTDTQVNRFFANIQHPLSAAITLSGSLSYEPSQLQGRPGVQPDADETTTRFGLGLSWQPTKNWTVTGTFDLDRIDSDVADRSQDRDRYGVAARYTF